MPPNSSALGEPVRAAPSAAAAAPEAAATAPRAFTWQEVAKHNTGDSAWVIIDGLVYDVTPFMDRHPGGREMMLLAAGRECTDLFRMYHWYDGGKKPREVMEKYLVGRLEGATEFPLYAPDRAGFYDALSQRVRAYFERTYPSDPKGATKHPWPAVWRLGVMFAVAALCYGVVHGLLLPGLPLPAKLLFAALAGVFQAMPLMHAMHDACHTALGGSEVWWKVFGRLCLDWYAGGCMITWHHQHVIGHHVYTNVFMSDPDLPCSCVGALQLPLRAPLAPARGARSPPSPRTRHPPPPLPSLPSCPACPTACLGTCAGTWSRRPTLACTPTSGCTCPCSTASWACSRACRTT